MSRRRRLIESGEPTQTQFPAYTPSLSQSGYTGPTNAVNGAARYASQPYAGERSAQDAYEGALGNAQGAAASGYPVPAGNAQNNAYGGAFGDADSAYGNPYLGRAFDDPYTTTNSVGGLGAYTAEENEFGAEEYAYRPRNP